MTPQLQQVALTYLTRRGLWFFGRLASLSFLPMLVLGFVSSKKLDGSHAFAVIGMATAFLAFTVVTQAKWQFCNPRSRLLPGFAAPHVALILSLLIGGCALYPLGLAFGQRWSVLGAPACSIALAASIIWSLHRPHWLSTVTGMVAFLSLTTPFGLEFWVKADHAKLFAPYHVAILVAGWVAIARWIQRLRIVREEDADYVIPIQAQQGAATRMERTQASRALGKQFTRGNSQSRLSDWWHDRLLTTQATTTRARQRLLRYGFTPAPLWINAIWIAVSFGAMMGLISRYSISPTVDPISNGSVLWMMIVMPAIMAGGMLAQRRSRMAQELFYPLRRADYLSGLLKAAALNGVIVWLTNFVAMWALIAWMAPNRLFPAFIAPLTALSISVQIYAFGVLVNVARKDSGAVRMVASIVVVIPAMIGLMISMPNLPRPVISTAEHARLVEQTYAEIYGDTDPHIDSETRAKLKASVRRNVRRRWDSRRAQPYAPWVAAATLTALGLVTLLESRRRWLNLELG